MLFKIARRNVKRQIGDYLLYFITVSLTVALLFSVNNLLFGEKMNEMIEWFGRFIRPVLLGIAVILCAVIAFVLGYATTFLLKRRKKEFGVYLTLGMSRKNVLTVFAGETAVTFLVSLGAGVLLGLALYQALTAIFTNFLGEEYVFAAYSLTGSLLTAGMVAGTFLLSSLASLLYLRYAKITCLLQGETPAPKRTKNPVLRLFLWAAVLVLAVVLLCVAVSLFADWMEKPDFFNRVGELGAIVVLFLLSAALIPAALFKTVVSLCLYVPPVRKAVSRGTGTFTVRQLSARLDASAVMMGILTVLLSIAVIGPNVFLSIDSAIDARYEAMFAFDICSFGKTRSEYVAALGTIEEYADIEGSCVYAVASDTVTDGDYLTQGNFRIHESEFAALTGLGGFTAPALEGGYLKCNVSGDSFAFRPYGRGDKKEFAGVTYTCIGTLTVPENIFRNAYIPYLYVLPDGAQIGGEFEGFGLGVTLKSPRYDVFALRRALADKNEWGTSVYYTYGYSFREYERKYDIGQIALFLIGDLFISAVFILLSMALLALKTLSTVAEDKERYRTLYRLGAGEGALARSLFTQIFSYCFLPFLVPLALCFPLADILTLTVGQGGAALGAGAIAAQVAGFAGLLSGVYALYFLVTFLVAWRDVKRSLVSWTPGR